MGLRLRDVPSRALSWRDLWVIIRSLPQSSAFYRALDPDWQWDLQAQIGAGIYDLLAGANWQRGGGESERPKPLPRPGLERAAGATDAQKVTASEVRAKVAAARNRNRKIAGRS